MSQNNRNPLRGHQEAARFVLENPLPENDALYSRRRAERYPNLDKNQLPAETLTSREVYKERQRENDRARHHYRNVKDQEERYLEGRDEAQRMYYKEHSKDILPSGHRRLEPLAGIISEAEFRQARARENTIKDHPYMYVSLESKEEHHQYVQQHYHSSDRAYNDQREHARYMAARPSTSRRDLYGREPSRDSQAYHEPYPPNFPPAGFYSTTRGPDPNPTGDDWTEVKKPRKGRK